MCTFVGRITRALSLLAFNVPLWYFAGALATYITISHSDLGTLGTNSTMTPAQTQELINVMREVYDTHAFPAVFQLWGWIAVSIYSFFVLCYLAFAVHKSAQEASACCMRCGDPERERTRETKRATRYAPMQTVAIESSSGGDTV